MDDLKPCPCGKTPKSLGLEQSSTYKYALVSGNCCGEWSLEFRTQYKPLDSEECMEMAVETWNRGPRGGETTYRSPDGRKTIPKEVIKVKTVDRNAGNVIKSNILGHLGKRFLKGKVNE